MTTTTMRNALLLFALAAIGCADEPRNIEVTVSPSRQYYRSGQSVELIGQVTNQAGNPVDNARVTWIVDPPQAATAVGDGAALSSETFRLAAQGRVTISGCVGASCDSVALRVDDGSPVLEIESPQPGAELDDPDGIRVVGSVSDRGVARVFVAGQPVATDEIGRFETTLDAAFGVNHVSVTASDGLTEESTVAMDVLWAPAYAAAISDLGTPELRLENGISLSLGQQLLDDGVPLDPEITPIATDDLADILGLVAARMPLLDRIPDPVIDEPDFTLRVAAADTGPVTSSIDVTAEGVEVFLRLSELRLTTEGTLVFSGETLDLAGVVLASVAAAGRISVTKASEADPIEVDLSSLILALETVDGQFVDEETDAVFLLAEGALRTTIEDQLLAGVEETLAAALPTVLEDLLVGLDTGLADIEVVLDNPLLPAPITFLIDGRLASVTSHRGVEMLSTLRTTVGTTTEAVHPDSRGVPLLTAPGTIESGFFRDRALQVGVRLDFLNGLLHALWSSGALEIDISEQLTGELGDLAEGGRLSARLAPVARPSRPGESDTLVLSLGQVEVEIDLPDGQQARFGVGLDTAIDADIVDNALVVVAPGEPRVRVWTLEAAEGTVFTEDLIAAVLKIQWKQIRDSIVESLRFDLPVPALGALGELAPDLANLELSVELAEPAELRGSTVMLHGALRGVLPE
jgi:hypothetical protein